MGSDAQLVRGSIWSETVVRDASQRDPNILVLAVLQTVCLKPIKRGASDEVFERSV